MSALGAILVQPQKLSRASVSADRADGALLEDVLELAVRLLTDAGQGGPMLRVMGEATEAAAGRFVQQMSGGLESAREKLRERTEPLVSFVRSLTSAPLTAEAGDAPELAKAWIEQLASFAGALTLEQIREQVDFALGVLRDDLHVDGPFLEAQIWALVDDVIERLEAMPPEEDEAQHGDRSNRLATIAVMRRLRRRLRPLLELPRLDTEEIARAVMDLIRRTGIDVVGQKAECVLDGLGDALDVVTALDGLVSASVSVSVGPQSVPKPLGAFAAAPAADPAPAPAAEGKPTYLWYASWLLQYKTFFLFGLSDIKNAHRFVTDVKSDPGPFGRWLREQLSTETRQALESYNGVDEPPRELLIDLLTDLNRLIQGPSFYDAARFAQVSIQDETRELTGQSLEGDERTRFNRMLLEDAFPERLEKLPRGGFKKFLAGFWEFLRDDAAGWPGARVWIDAEGKRLMHGDKPLFKGAGLDVSRLGEIPLFSPDSEGRGHPFWIFENIGSPFLDGWAFHSSWGNDLIRLIWHLAQMQPNHRVASILDSVHDLAHGLTKLIGKRPFSGFDFFSSKWLEWMLGAPLLLTTAASWEGKHREASGSNIFWFWLTVWLADILALAGPYSATNLLREFTLSMFTLINFGGPRLGPPRPIEGAAENYKELDGILAPSILLFTWILAKQVRREEYVNPGGMPGRVAAIWLLGGAGMGLLAGLVGVQVAAIFAWAEDWALLGKKMLTSIPKVWIQFWPLLYSVREGDTDDGRFNPAGGAFAGYPGKPSPYRLPYAEGTTLFCGQGNAGMWSHNVIFNPTPAQTYAYDFAHDQGEEVLACRAGTVVSFSEGTPDDTTGTWNSIVIRHDVDDSGNPIAPDPAYDRDVGGSTVVTFAVYGHGRQNGVTDAFARWATPVPTANIVGTRVRRGQPILLAGDTGTSFHNHLHLHVLAEMLPPGATAPTSPASNATQNNAYTIPFVFDDVDGDGICKALTWYTSKNTRVT